MKEYVDPLARLAVGIRLRSASGPHVDGKRDWVSIWIIVSSRPCELAQFNF